MNETDIKTIDTKKISICSHLLPDPGGEVVRELCVEIERLKTELLNLSKDLAAYNMCENNSCAECSVFGTFSKRAADMIIGDK